MQLADGSKVEYRVWNPFRSKLAAAVLGGVENIYMPPGSKVMYLGGASGTTVSHVSDIVSVVKRNMLYSRRTCLGTAASRTAVVVLQCQVFVGRRRYLNALSPVVSHLWCRLGPPALSTPSNFRTVLAATLSTWRSHGRT